jgi:orotate phosphoribosyltransferase
VGRVRRRREARRHDHEGHEKDEEEQERPAHGGQHTPPRRAGVLASGADVNPADRDLAKLLVERSYLEGDFTLSSGGRSRHYFDCRITTCFAEAMPLIGRAFAGAFRRAGTWPRAVGGMTMAADPVAAAIALQSLADGPAIDLFSVRKERKQHGTGKWIEGCAASPLAVVDDVATTGASVLKAIERCREEGFSICHAAVLVDREEGGMDAIRAALPGVAVTAIFTRSELDALRDAERGR